MRGQTLDAARQSIEQTSQRVALEPSGGRRSNLGRSAGPLENRSQVTTRQIPHVAAQLPRLPHPTLRYGDRPSGLVRVAVLLRR